MADVSYVESTGTVLPDTTTLLGTVENEYRLALGTELNTDPATPQGRLIAGEVSARDTYLRNMAALANQINPNLAGGVFLDAIWALTGGQRIAATASVVMGVELAGIAGTIIPEGTQARTSAGDVFETLSAVVLDGTGNATVDFASIALGPVPCGAGDLNTPVTGILGWESVVNPNAGTPGRLVESDVASRLRRRRTLALQGTALPEAITSALYGTDGVSTGVPGLRSLSFRENVTAAPAVIDGVNMVAHSIFVCVDGGADSDIAMVLLEKKSAGAAWNGTTTVNVTEPTSGQIYPVQFQRPDLIAVKVRATVRAAGAVTDPATVVRAALIAYANGDVEGEQGFAVGISASPFELAGAISIAAPGIYVQKVEIAKLADAYGTVEIPIAVFEKATLNVNNIEVVLV